MRRPLLALLVLILVLAIGYTANALRKDHHPARPSPTVTRSIG